MIYWQFACLVTLKSVYLTFVVSGITRKAFTISLYCYGEVAMHENKQDLNSLSPDNQMWCCKGHQLTNYSPIKVCHWIEPLI